MADWGNVINATFGSNQGAQQAAVDVDADPEKAVRALDVSQATGIPPETIAQDDDGDYERAHKTQLAQAIVGNNQHISDYLTRKPLASQVSNGDYGNLDVLGQAVGKFRENSILWHGIKGFQEGFGDRGLGSWLPIPEDFKERQQFQAEHPFVALTLPWLAGAGALPEAVLRLGMGALTGGTNAAMEAYRQATGDQDAQKHGEKFLQTIGDPGLWASIGLPDVLAPLTHNAELRKQVSDAAKVLDPYIRQGEEPPVGIHEAIDEVHQKQSELDLKNLNEAVAAGEKTATKQRVPEYLADFVKSYNNENIGINADAVRELYGGKPPSIDDNKLGWIPRLQEQMESGAPDIEVPLADYLSKIDPELHKELEDHIRMRDNGITKAEGEKLAEHREIEAPDIEKIDIPAKSFDEFSKRFEFDPNRYQTEPGDLMDAEEALVDKEVQHRRIVQEYYDTYKTFYGNIVNPKEGTVGGKDVPVEQLKAHVQKIKNTLEASREDGRGEGHLLAEQLAYEDGIKALSLQDERGNDQVLKAVRKASALEPLFKDRSLEMREMPEDVEAERVGQDPMMAMREASHDLLGGEVREPSRSDVVQGFQDKKEPEDVSHGFTLHDKSGAEVGELYFTEEKGGKRLFVDDIRGTGGKGPQDLGTAAIYSVLKQIAEKYPKADELLGYRVSGAREKSGKDNVKASIDLNKFRARKATPVREQQLELPQVGTTAIEDRDIVAKASGFGLTVPQYKLWMKAIIDRRQADIEAATEVATRDQKRRETQQWKTNRAAMREEVEGELKTQPEFQADEFLPKYGIQKGSLPKEVESLLPEGLVTDRGIHADDLANLVGHPDASDLALRIGKMQEQRAKSGMSKKKFFDRVVDIETDRLMEEKYRGDLLTEIKDQVASETQEILLHSEMLILAEKAGMELPLPVDAIRSEIIEKFKGLTHTSVSRDKLLAAAGRAGRDAELALLKGDPAEGFRQKQRQFISMVMSKEAAKLEKAQEASDKFNKRYSKADVPGVHPQFKNVIQDAMIKVGLGVGRSLEDIQKNLNVYGFKNLTDWSRDTAYDLFVPEWWEGNNKTFPELSVGEFYEATKMFRAMNNAGRDMETVLKGGEKMDRLEAMAQMEEQIKDIFPDPKGVPIDRDATISDTAKAFWWSGINVESMFNRLDRGDPKGLFNQVFVRNYTQASNYKDKLIKDFQRKIASIGKIEGMDDVVQNDLWIDPLTQAPLKMRKRNVLGILQNVGNQGNLVKLAKGYGIEDPQAVIRWLAERTTKEDWDRAQKMGDIFKELFGMANTMSHNLNGEGIDSIPLKPIDTPFGQYPGWYNPIKYDRDRPGQSKRLMGSLPDGEQYFRATTPQGYTEKRTGYVAPVELNLDIVPVRMKQMVHDIAMRPAIVQMSKMFYDPDFKSMLTAHYGKDQAEALVPFLRDIAGAADFHSYAASMGTQAVEYFRQNTIATLIGLNPGTVMKHGTTALINSATQVGPINFAREFMHMINATDGFKDTIMAWQKSEELQRRFRNFPELIAGHGSEINIRGAQSKLMSWRDFAIQAGATPVSLSDLASSVPTWLAEYKKQILKDPSDEGQAIFEADRAVRQAHGSSILSNKPEIMRTNALGATFSSLYGFFSHMQQKQYELGWRARDMYKDASEGEYKKAIGAVPQLTKMFMSYIIWPAVIEELVTPYTNEEKDSWGMKAAKTMALGISSSFIGVRDFVRGLVNVRDPSAGLLGTSFKTITDVGHDLSKGKQLVTPKNAGNLIKHSFALGGVLTGLTNESEGRMLQYVQQLAAGKERSRGPFGTAVGLRYGTTVKHSRSWDEWLQHIKGK